MKKLELPEIEHKNLFIHSGKPCKINLITKISYLYEDCPPDFMYLPYINEESINTYKNNNEYEKLIKIFSDDILQREDTRREISYEYFNIYRQNENLMSEIFMGPLFKDIDNFKSVYTGDQQILNIKERIFDKTFKFGVDSISDIKIENAANCEFHFLVKDIDPLKIDINGWGNKLYIVGKNYLMKNKIILPTKTGLTKISLDSVILREEKDLITNPDYFILKKSSLLSQNIKIKSKNCISLHNSILHQNCKTLLLDCGFIELFNLIEKGETNINIISDTVSFEGDRPIIIDNLTASRFYISDFEMKRLYINNFYLTNYDKFTIEHKSYFINIHRYNTPDVLKMPAKSYMKCESELKGKTTNIFIENMYGPKNRTIPYSFDDSSIKFYYKNKCLPQEGFFCFDEKGVCVKCQ